MELREALRDRSKVGVLIGIALLFAAGFVFSGAYWPQKKANLSQAFYTTDDGKTWFTDDAAKAAPFEHNGKMAVVAHVYNYDNGKKEFCAFVAKFTPDARKKLEAEIAAAKSAGKPAESVGLFRDPSFTKSGVMVKKVGDENWILYGDPKAQQVFTIRAPDGSVVDEVFAY